MIELAQVSLSRGGTQILDKAFVRIESGHVVLISGPSGIGKTTLLSLIGGFVRADSGQVRVFEHEVSKLRASSTALLRRRLAFVPQELELIDDLSALANVRVALEVCGVPLRQAKQRALEALNALDLANEVDRPVSALSTGQRRRVSLARGLVRDADVFVADEPSNDLDADRVLSLVALIEDMREAGTAIVMASNDARLLSHAQQPGWRHLALSAGQLIAGDMAAMFNTQGKRKPVKGSSSAGVVLPFPVSAIVGD